MVKIFGSVLVLAACIGYTNGLMEKQKNHESILQSLVQILGLLMGEIRYERLPMAEAFCRMDKKYNGPAATVMKQIADKLASVSYENLEGVWAEAFRGEQKRLMLTDEELDILLDVGKNLGYLDADAQISHLEGCQKRLQQKVDAAAKEIAEKRKVYRYLGVAAGVLVILVLV